MAVQKRFEFLEITGDIYVAAYGEDLAEAFENAAAAMFETMTNIVDISPNVEDAVEVSGHDEEALLYNWLEALLVKFDVKEMLYSKFRIESLGKTVKGFGLIARIWGERFDPSKHLQKVGVKAVTYHQMEIIRQPEMVAVKFVLDI